MSEPNGQIAPAPGTEARRGLMLVLSSPSGAGKTTLAGRLLAADPEVSLSVSLTTRAPRSGEVDGRDYHFVTRPELERRRDAGDLLEWAEVHGNLYATPRAEVMSRLAQGRDVLFDVDWQGAQALAAKAPADVVRVFILPPSAEALANRLRTRAQDAAATVQRRLKGAAAEIAHWGEYDYVLVNADLDATSRRLAAILAAERLKRARQVGLDAAVGAILDGLKRL